MDGNQSAITLKSKQMDLDENFNGLDDKFHGSLSEQELQKIKEELGLIDSDGHDNPRSSTEKDAYVNGSDSESDEEATTPFDSPLTAAERRLLDQFTFGTTTSYCPSPNPSRSASLAEVADSLIKDLENYDFVGSHGEHYNSSYESDNEFDETLFGAMASTIEKEKDDSDLGSSVTSGVEGLERLVEQLVQRKKSKVLNNIENKPPMDTKSMDTGSPLLNNEQSTHSLDCSPINDSCSSSVNSDSFTTSVDSGLPVSASIQPQHRYFVVVAIDFGTTFSGYAFAFTRDPTSIHMMRRWEGGDPGVTNQKTPTTLLLKPDGSFHSYGFGARDFYHDLEPDEARKWLFFEKFKMALHTKKDLNKAIEIKAANGRSIKALTVFAHALKFFKDHVIEELTDQSATQILEDDIQWVITVPAIWKAPAKQFMRNAAYEAGLATLDDADRILIALEPEAASIFCRKLKMRDCLWEESKRRSSRVSLNTDNRVADGFQDRTRYLVVDCGGGTVDLTVHELDTKAGTLEELHKGTGGACGGTGVDEEFEMLLKKIFGKDFIEQFKYKRPAGWVDMMIAFEAKKRTASPTKTNPLNISLPFVFIDYYKKHKGSSIESAVKKFGNPNVKWSSQGLLRIAPDTMKELFSPVVKQIIQHIRVLLSTRSVSDVRYLFLVGGFAESPLLQYAVRDAFGSQMQIIIPHDVSLTILKGAVLFGLNPTVIRVRRAAMTYGVGVLNRYVIGKHPKSKLVKKNGIEWCTDVFDKFVAADQAVKLGDKVTRSYAPAKPGQNFTVITIYSSEQDNIIYVTDSGVKKCGQLKIELPDVEKYDASKPREIQACMEFGDTEIRVSAVDVVTGLEAKATIDFLSS
ncbi:hypothetical protein QZH41_012080 [Actinostola sp. cb2023]|nr:hypothetical protein QZH41_012080 [Actinostola sp. cb2023]